eukprot:Awhi_evm1s6336
MFSGYSTVSISAFSQSIHLLIVNSISLSLFYVEMFCLLFLTRSCWITVIKEGRYVLAAFFSMTTSIITFQFAAYTAYILDCFTFPLLHIYTKCLGSDSDYSAQIEITKATVTEVICDEEVYQELKVYAKSLLNEENVLYINAILILTGKKNDDDKNLSDMIKNEAVLAVYEQYIDQDSAYEINLTSSVLTHLKEERWKYLEQGETSVDNVIMLFQASLNEISKLVRTNLLINFLKTDKINKIILERKRNHQIAQNLTSLGLYTTTMSMSDSMEEKSSTEILVSSVDAIK